ncbi:hypothetical protein M8C21_018978 [Ambrosia artemisiifolia]|uniref:Uncharacterized protein n=1 Tax=Ambrosia artemisiifolia TaxID=4212 RepID=A0AAD5GRH8_AMBAR|nr:hypothetical protein M8C21_018978 [Ambrosia artemisiifolia]
MLGHKRKGCATSESASMSSSVSERVSLYLDVGDCDRSNPEVKEEHWIKTADPSYNSRKGNN